MAEPKISISLELTPQQARAILLAGLVLVGAYPTINFLTPYGRSDPYTGTQGRAVEDRATKLEDRTERLEEFKREAQIKLELFEHRLEYCVRDCEQ